MRLRILICGFLFINFGIFNAFAQNIAKGDTKKPFAPKLPNINSEKTPEQIEYEKIFKNLTPEQKTKFDQINREFFKRSMEAVNSLNHEVNRIAKISNILSIVNRIFPSHTQQNANSTPYNEISNKVFQEYSKLPTNKQKLIKIEIIKFRKTYNKNETERASQMKAIFKKNFSIFKVVEDLSKIEADEKTISQN